MGKKVISQASPKISKNHGKKMKKQQINSLIQVLRPKVYITDSSSFKNLVQKLTGSGSSSSSSSSPTAPPITHQETVVDNHGGDPEISSSWMETISNASLDSFDPCCYYPVSSSSSPSSTEEEFLNKYDAVYDPIFLEETTTSVECLLMNHQQQAAGLLEFQDLESWLLDMEPPAAAAYSSCNIVSGHPIPQEVSIYDYDISGFI